MIRKNVIIIGSFLALFSASIAYANNCPGSEGCPIDAKLFAALKAQGVPVSEIAQANHYLAVYATKLSNKTKQ